MDIEKYIIKRSNEVLNTSDATITKRLEGGMSNYTYIVGNNGKQYTYRVPGKYAEKFVDRAIEKDNIGKAEKMGLNNKTIYFDIATGEKMAEFVEGTILSDTDVTSFDAEAANAIKTLHCSDISMNDYNPFGRLDTYEQYCHEYKFTHSIEYASLRKSLEMLRPKYDSTRKVPCHCDFQPSNLVSTPSKLYVLDWEYAGMNDPFYDIACYGNAGLGKALSLLEAYLGHTPTCEELNRMYFWRSFQCLQWFNVAIFKDCIGLGKDLNLDFVGIANTFLKMAEQLIDLAKNGSKPLGADSLTVYGQGTK